MMKQKMKAVTCKKYGPPEMLELIETDKPQPRKNEVLISVKASAVTASDVIIRTFDVPRKFRLPMKIAIGFRRPRRTAIGLVFAGVVESAGAKIRRFKEGDRVYGMSGFSLGTYAEYLCLKEEDSTAGCISILPDSVSFEEGTYAVYGGSLALQFLEKAHLEPGRNILVYGASGTTGTFAVQYAKSKGANVTAVCSTTNVDFMKSLGADHVIDYIKTSKIKGATFDFILDAVGKRKTSQLKESCMDALKPDGFYASIDDGNLILNSSRLDEIARLVTEGRVKPVLDRTYPLEEIVEAHRYVQKGHKRGGVAITIQDPVGLEAEGN